MPYKDKSARNTYNKQRMRLAREKKYHEEVSGNTKHIWSVLPVPVHTNKATDEVHYYEYSKKPMTATLLDGTVIPLRRRISLEQQGIPYD
jgi:hypothetical protein